MNILQMFGASDIERHPYPHILREGVLDEELCRQLAQDFPPLESFTGCQQHPPATKLCRYAGEVMEDPSISPRFREFVAEHVRPAVVGEVFRLFAGDLEREYPDFQQRICPFTSPRIGVRYIDSPGEYDVLLDVILGVLTPTGDKPDAQRLPHIKNPDKFFEAVLYLPDPRDDGPGGEIEIYEMRKGIPMHCGELNQIDPLHVRLVRWLPYRLGAFFGWVNTLRSIQQYAIRPPSQHPLRWMGFLTTITKPLFEVPRGPLAPVTQRAA